MSAQWIQFVDEYADVVVVNLAHVVSVVRATILAGQEVTIRAGQEWGHFKAGEVVTQITVTEVYGGDSERYTIGGETGSAVWRQFRKLAGLTED